MSREGLAPACEPRPEYPTAAISLEPARAGRSASRERRQGHRAQPDAAIGEKVPPRPFTSSQGERPSSIEAIGQSPIHPPGSQVDSGHVTLESRIHRGSRARGRRSSSRTLSHLDRLIRFGEQFRSVSSSRLEGGSPQAEHERIPQPLAVRRGARSIALRFVARAPGQFRRTPDRSRASGPGAACWNGIAACRSARPREHRRS